MDFFNELCNNKIIDYDFIFISNKRDVLFKKKISQYENERFLSKSTFLSKGNFKLLRKLIANKTDIIIIGGFPAYYITVVLYKILFKAKLVCWWGGTKLINGSRNELETAYRRIMTVFLNGAIYYSKLAQDHMNDLSKKLKHEFILGNNTRNSEAFHKKVIEQKVTNNSERFYVLTVGALKTHKNTILILKAINSNSFLKKNIKLIVIGEGQELDELRQFSKQNKIQVEFLGHVNAENIYNYYSLATVFVHPSKYDQWPQVYNEAISSGLPTLISNHSEVYDEYTNRYYDKVVFDANNYEELALKLVEILTDNSLQSELSEFALKTAFNNNGISKAQSFNEFLLSVK